MFQIASILTVVSMPRTIPFWCFAEQNIIAFVEYGAIDGVIKY